MSEVSLTTAVSSKTTGDGLLVEFASVVDAVRCAIDVQRGMAERNTEVPPDRGRASAVRLRRQGS
jgi:class 3 adenylate cyclase